MESTANSTVENLFLAHSVSKLAQMAGFAEACLMQLSNEQVWARDGAHQNAVGNLILHLCGNLRQWILHGVGNQPDVRARPAEFSANAGLGSKELLDMFAATIAEAMEVLAGLPGERLLERIDPQGRGETSVLEAIYQSVGHVQQHMGQIILLTKEMTGRDLDLTLPRPR